MILTEDQAKTKWCFKAISLYQETVWIPNGTSSNHVPINLPVGVNRDTPNGNIPACIASHCQAWRWAEAKKLRDIDLVTSEVEEGTPRLGFCGIAGKPEYD